MVKKRNKKGKSIVQEPVVTDRKTPIHRHRIFPLALFLILSLVYFNQFVFSERILFGYDAGLDFHLGANLNFWEKVETLVQPKWHMKMGGLPSSEEIRPQYFPTYPLYFFTSSFHRYLGWRYILTMCLAGWGMFLFLRQINVRYVAALWGGVAYMSAPTLMAFTYAGQYAKMGVIALYPFMWFFLDRGLKRVSYVDFAGLAILIGCGLYSPHPKMLYYALCGVGLFFCFRMWQLHKGRDDIRLAVRRVLLFVSAIALGLGLGAEGTLPLYTYTSSESKRAADVELSGRSEAEQLAFAQSWSLHPEEVASLVLPEFGGFNVASEGYSTYWGRNPAKDNSEYFGVLVVILAFVMLPDVRGRPFVAFLTVGGVLALAFTLGQHTPVHWLAYHVLPGLKMFRAVGMAAFLFAFPACVLAALALSRLLEPESDELKLLKSRLLLSGGLAAAFALLVAVWPAGITSAWIDLFYSDIVSQKRQILTGYLDWLSKGAAYVFLVVVTGLAALWLRFSGYVNSGVLFCVFVGLTIADTWRINTNFLKYVHPNQHADIRTENRSVKALMRAEGDMFRILPLPDYQILGQPGYSMEGIPSITGFHDLTVGRYDHVLRYIEPATRALWNKYAVGVEVPYRDGQLLEAIHPLLNLLNGKYLLVPSVLPVEIDRERFPFVGEEDKYKVFLNPSARPWAYTVSSVRVDSGSSILDQLVSGAVDLSETALVETPMSVQLDGESTSEDVVRLIEHDPSGGVIRIQTQANGPRLLVLSENYQANWSVYIDGEQGNVLRANYVWKAVVVPKGSHDIEFRYHSEVLLVSRIVSVFSLALILCTFLFMRRKTL